MSATLCKAWLRSEKDHLYIIAQDGHTYYKGVEGQDKKRGNSFTELNYGGDLVKTLFMNERQIESTNFAIQFANGTYGDAKLIETEATIHETIHAIRKANNALGSKDDGKDY